MADVCVFTSRGLKGFNYRDENKKRSCRGFQPNRNLRIECQIEDGVKLSHIFNAVDKDPDLCDFISKYAWCPEIKEFHKQSKQPNKGKNEEIERLEVYWYAAVNTYDGIDYLTIEPEFHGLGTRDNEKMSFALDLIPTNEIAHLPIKLNTTVNLKKKGKATTNTLERPEKYKQSQILKAEKCFSLLEVLDAIYMEISFVGGPEEVSSLRNELARRVRTIKEQTAKLLPI